MGPTEIIICVVAAVASLFVGLLVGDDVSSTLTHGAGRKVPSEARNGLRRQCCQL